MFCNKKHVASWVAKELEQRFGVKCSQIHGDRTQGQREKALAEFKAGRARVLVATDAVARGIDVVGVRRDPPRITKTFS